MNGIGESTDSPNTIRQKWKESNGRISTGNVENIGVKRENHGKENT